ncbi:MAG: PAS domain S-box protein [Balneolaceae bacterium]|nr:PAS domain S-box protein [Balneolaceae bacterium]
MEQPFQILLVEDNRDDVELLQLQLKKMELEFSLDVVDQKADFITYFENNEPDLIICDYNLPGFTGVEALEYVRKQNFELPFILISGYIGEEKAVDAMLKGASDYVLKDNIKRLAPAVKREIIHFWEHKKTETERDQAIQNLKERVKEQKCLYNISSLDEQKLSISDLLQKAVRYLPEGFTFPEITEASIEYDGKSFQTPNYSETEWFFSETTDKTQNISLTIKVVYLEDKPESDIGPFIGEEQNLINSIIEILSLKINRILDEQKLDRKQDLLEKTYNLAQMGNWEVDLVHSEIHWSFTTKRIHEVPEDFEPDLETGINFYKEGKDRKKIRHLINRAIEKGESFDTELRIITAKNNEKWIRVIGESEFKDGKCIRIFGSFQDIDNRKRAEIALQESEQRFKSLVQEGLDLIAIIDIDGNYKYVAPTRYRIDEMGMQPEEYRGKNAFEIFHEDDHERLKRALRSIQPYESTDLAPFRYKTDEGEWRWMESTITNLTENPAVNGFVTNSRDVTDRIEQERKLRDIVEHSTNMFYQHDTEGVLTYVSPQSSDFLGYSPEEAIRKWTDFITDHPLNKKGEQITQRAIDTGEIQEPYELQLKTADGRIIWVEVNEAPLIKEGKVQGIVGSLTDITERKAAEELIKKSNEKLNTAQEIAKLGYFEFYFESDEIYWSDQSYKIWEYDPNEIELTLDLIFERMHPEDRDYFIKQHEQTVKTGKTLNLEHRIQFPDGRIKWVRVIGDLKRSSEGKPVAVEGTAQDITDKKLADLELEEAYNEIETILESIGEAFFAVDKNWTVTYWNNVAEEVLHRPRKEILGKNLWDVYEDATELEFYTQYHKAVNEKITVHFEEFYPTLGKWFEVSAYPSENGLSVFFRDITEQKENREKIERINERFEKVTEATNDAIWDFDVIDDNLYWGRGFETLFGYDLDEISPDMEFLISLIHPEDRERISHKIQNYMKPGGEQDWFEEYRFQKADGTYAYVMDRAVFIRNKNGKVTRVVGAMTDLTRQKEIEESLKQLNIELEQRAEELTASNAELEQFAYVASHDLQEPLRMVTSFLTQLDKKYSGQLDEKANQYIHYAVDGAQRMRQIILDLLNYSRLNRDQQKHVETDLNEIFQEVQALARSRIKETGATIESDSLPTLEVNPVAIKQVLQNLLSNALKYQEGDTTPQINVRAEELDTHWKFSFEDNGIGINPEFKDTIFQIFQRLHTRDQYSGTGIGLAIAKKIIERHGGEIWVESEEGEGSTFYFTIEK